MEKLNDMPYIPDLKGMGFTAPTDNKEGNLVMSNSSFDPDDHPREKTGQFTQKSAIVPKGSTQNAKADGLLVAVDDFTPENAFIGARNQHWKQTSPMSFVNEQTGDRITFSIDKQTGYPQYDYRNKDDSVITVVHLAKGEPASNIDFEELECRGIENDMKEHNMILDPVTDSTVIQVRYEGTTTRGRLNFTRGNIPPKPPRWQVMKRAEWKMSRDAEDAATRIGEGAYVRDPRCGHRITQIMDYLHWRVATPDNAPGSFTTGGAPDVPWGSVRKLREAGKVK